MTCLKYIFTFIFRVVDAEKQFDKDVGYNKRKKTKGVLQDISNILSFGIICLVFFLPFLTLTVLPIGTNFGKATHIVRCTFPQLFD